MKKVYSFLTILAATLFWSACVPLDTPPYDRDSDLSFWENDPDAAISALNTCYVSLTDMYGLVYSDGTSDNAYVKGGQTKAIGNGTYGTSESYIYGLWGGAYSGIRDCNELLANIDKTSVDAALKARYTAEARVLRAWHYYDLYTRFGGVPYITTPISIAQSRSLKRDSKDFVVGEIIKELESVISSDVLPASYSADEDRGRITKWAAIAILAKVHLFEGNFSAVRDLTARIMSESGIVLFPSYSGLFEIANEYCPEIILSSQYKPVFKEHDIMYHLLPPSMGGYTNIAPLKSLVDSYIMLDGKTIDDPASTYDSSKPWADRDPRLAATIVYPGNDYPSAINGFKEPQWDGGDGYNYSSDVTPTGYYIRKWFDSSYRLTLQSGLNPIIIRYADILLMNAEAHAELGTLDANVWNATIRLIRARAGFTAASALDFPGTDAPLKEIVRNERRSELAFEGSRRNDIIRWRIAEEVLSGWCHGLYTGENAGTDGGYVRIELRQFDPARHYLWPIPQKERDLNHNLEQNPNW